MLILVLGKYTKRTFNSDTGSSNMKWLLNLLKKKKRDLLHLKCMAKVMHIAIWDMPELRVLCDKYHSASWFNVFPNLSQHPNY